MQESRIAYRYGQSETPIDDDEQYGDADHYKAARLHKFHLSGASGNRLTMQHLR